MIDDQQQQTPPQEQLNSGHSPAKPPGSEKKVIAGVLGIVFGWIGVHKFVLGYQREGIIMASIGGLSFIVSMIPLIQCISIFPFMAVMIIGLIEGIVYLTKSDDEFVETYINGKKGWF